MERVTEAYHSRLIEARPFREASGRWSVGVRICGGAGGAAPRDFRADDGIVYILEEEAAAEALRFGRCLVDRGMA